MPHTKDHTPIPDRVDLPEDAVVSGGDDPDAATVFKDRSTARSVSREISENTRVQTIKHNGEQRATIARKTEEKRAGSASMEVYQTDG